MTYDFDSAPDRRHRNSIKWNRYGGRDVLPLWVADMDFAVPEAVTTALHERVEHPVFGYTHAPEATVEAFLTHVARHFGWQPNPEWLVWLPGAVPALHTACRLIEPQDKIVTTSPIYPPFRSAPTRMGRQRLDVPLVGDGDGRLQRDLDGLENAFVSGGKLLFFCNPHNPSGTMAKRSELEALAERILRHDTVVIADELHADLVLDDNRQHIPLASISQEIATRSITLMAPSKTFNLAGLGLTCAIIPDADLRERFRAVTEWVLPLPTTLAWTAAGAAWWDGQDWLRALLDYLRGNRDAITAALADLPQVKAHPPEATYLYWLDLRDCGLADPAAYLEQHGLGLSDGADFGAPGFVRLNFACPRATLDMALDRLALALNAL